MGKKRIIAETGAGQHGVATATVCALLGMECVVYMGEVDMARQELNVLRMRLLGAEVRGVASGSKHAEGRHQRGHARLGHQRPHDLLSAGQCAGGASLPDDGARFSSLIGLEMKEQILEKEGRLPTAMIACVGGGSNAIGAFYEFLGDHEVRLIGVEAGGCGTELGEHAARFSGGEPGVLQGTYSYVLQDENGQIALTHSVSAGSGLCVDRAGARGAARFRARGVRFAGRCGGAGCGGEAGADGGNSAGARKRARRGRGAANRSGDFRPVKYWL